MKTLFLNPPSFSRFDSAGARFAATRVTQSLWYPAWLGFAAALVSNSKLIDCPAEAMSLEKLLPRLKTYDLIVIYTSTPSFTNDLKVAEKIKKLFPKVKIIFAGPHVSVLPEQALTSKSIDGVARKEFEETILEVSLGKSWKNIKGLSFKSRGKIIHNPDRPPLLNLNKLPFVAPIYKRDLPLGNYHLPFALYPYLAIYAGRGCPNRCSFCLWPQTFTGRIFRKRSVDNVINEVKWIKKNLPEIKEIFFDDDTFTVNHTWVREFCDKVKHSQITWSTNARADVPLELLKQMKDSGCRLLVVGYESGNEKILRNIHKGVTLAQMRKFTENAKKAGLMIHGTFVLGLPGETLKTIGQTFRFACLLDCDTIQVSMATPFPGTEFYSYCQTHHFLKETSQNNQTGHQQPFIDYPNLPGQTMEKEVRRFLIRYYFRPSYLVKTAKMALRDWAEAKRISGSFYEFVRYLL